MGPTSDVMMPVQAPARTRRVRVLQAQEAGTLPYAAVVTSLGKRLTFLERWLRRFISDRVTAGYELFFRRNAFEVVLTSDYRTSLLFGSLSNLFGRRARHIVKELYLDEQVLASSFKRWCFRWALHSCEHIVTNCSAEIATYSQFLNLPAERFTFLPWPSNLPLDPHPSHAGYVLAAGRSFRDWKTLAAAASQVERRFVVIAERGAVASLDWPENVELQCDIPRPAYLDLLRNAWAVVVPLLPTARSTGQATVLEAMALGKPVVAAAVAGVVDYIQHDENGLLFSPCDASSLVQQLNRLAHDRGCHDRLAAGAAESIERCFNKRHYSERMLELVTQLVETAPVDPGYSQNTNRGT